MARTQTEVLALSVAMRDAARTARWDEVDTLEAQRAQHLAQPALRAALDAVPAGQVGATRAWLEALLACDVETRRLAETERDELRGQLASSSNARRLADAYGSGDGSP